MQADRGGFSLLVQLSLILWPSSRTAPPRREEGDIAPILERLESAYSFSDSEPETISRIVGVIR